MSEKMTVYHGTGRLGKCDFDEFKPDYRGAIWTVTKKEQAEKYAPPNENGVVLTCEAELKNPAHFAYGSGENWDIDDTVRKAREAGCDSAIIDFEFRSREHDYFKFVLENYPDEPAKKLSVILQEKRIQSAVRTKLSLSLQNAWQDRIISTILTLQSSVLNR